MNVKKQQRTISVALSEKEKNLFTRIACEVDMPHNLLVRHFIRDFLAGKISWNELLGQHIAVPARYTLDGSEKKEKRLRIKLDLEQYVAFTQRVEELGSTTGTVLRKLIFRYVAEKIEGGNI